MSDSSDTLAHATPSNVAFLDERLKAYTVDLELMRTFWLGTSKVDFSIGGRYASFSAGQNIDSSGASAGGDFGATANAWSDFSFNGAGVTTGFLGHTPIGYGTGFSLLWGLRGSVLWGEAQRRGATSVTGFGTTDSGLDVFGFDEHDRETAYIVEAILGVEWRRELPWVPMSAYVRLAFEYQFWNLGSGPTDSSSVSTAGLVPTPPPSATARASVGDVEMNLVGLMIGAGLNW
jgi:hypothetical protein